MPFFACWVGPVVVGGVFVFSFFFQVRTVKPVRLFHHHFNSRPRRARTELTIATPTAPPAPLNTPTVSALANELPSMSSNTRTIVATTQNNMDSPIRLTAIEACDEPPFVRSSMTNCFAHVSTYDPSCSTTNVATGRVPDSSAYSSAYGPTDGSAYVATGEFRRARSARVVMTFFVLTADSRTALDIVKSTAEPSTGGEVSPFGSLFARGAVERLIEHSGFNAPLFRVAVSTLVVCGVFVLPFFLKPTERQLQVSDSVVVCISLED
jgi:hypothetical protein